MRILIADDDPISRIRLKMVLDEWDYEVQAVVNGTEAWEVLQQDDAPRLAILDWLMPGMDGDEVCRRVREYRKAPYTYIILCTSKGKKEELLEGMRAGADDYVVKPFDSDELNVRLRAGRRIIELQEEVLEANRKLTYNATHDLLTDVLNHRAIMEILAYEMERHSKERTGLGVIMSDIDRFKNVNDTYGHIAGDVVLKEVAACIKQESGKHNYVGRYGGEEFMVVLPHSDGETAFAIAENIRKKIEACAVTLPFGQIKVTISIGLGIVPPRADALQDTLVQAADFCLYQAKNKGRNRTEMTVMDV